MRFRNFGSTEFRKWFLVYTQIRFLGHIRGWGNEEFPTFFHTQVWESAENRLEILAVEYFLGCHNVTPIPRTARYEYTYLPYPKSKTRSPVCARRSTDSPGGRTMCPVAAAC